MYLTPRIVAAGMAALSLLLTTYHASPAAGQPSDEKVTVTDHAAESPAENARAFYRNMFYAAQHAYDKSLEQFKAGKIGDPEVVYRWSLRLMKTHQAAGEDRVAPAAVDHLRRMMELAVVVESDRDNENAPLHELAVKYYRAEAESLLAKATAKPDTVASLSPDDAVKAAETYLGAVLEGNYDEAAELAVPGSLATSKRLMDTIKGLISNKSISVLAIQTSGRRTTVLMQEAQSPDIKPDGRSRAQFTVALEPKDGRWLVNTFSVHKPGRSQNRNPLLPSTEPASGKSAARVPTDSDPFGTPSSAGPKVTKVIVLKNAKANDLATTIAALNRGSGSDDFTIAVDERTNRLIIRGTNERISEILALIEQLDVPGPARTTEGADRGGGGYGREAPRGNYGGAR